MRDDPKDASLAHYRIKILPRMLPDLLDWLGKHATITAQDVSSIIAMESEGDAAIVRADVRARLGEIEAELGDGSIDPQVRVALEQERTKLVGASIADFDLNHPTDQTEQGEFGNLNPQAAKNGATAIAGFSSRGPSGDRLVKPDLTAPGSYVVSAESSTGGEVKAADAVHKNNYETDPTYAVLSGTSMA